MTRAQGSDFIIVGAGSAGAVLANRLSASGQDSVLVIEAGGRDRDPLIHIPVGIGKIYQHRWHDWGYDTEPDPGLDGRSVEAMRGKVVGGSHAINVMFHTRGDRSDYDRWAREEGATGWSYQEVLPYFKRGETWCEGENPWRGGSGELHVRWSGCQDPVSEAWLQAGQAAGFPVCADFNGEQAEGFGRLQFTIHRGRRHTAARAHLIPAMSRPNLGLVVQAQVTRILFEGRRAVGVEYLRDGTVHQAWADKEVILAAGAFNTPQLLMLSGVGPAQHLQSHGITPRIDLPVGRQLQDHLAAWLSWPRLGRSPFSQRMRADRMALDMVRAGLFGTGPATDLPGGVVAFVKTDTALAAPDIEFMFRTAAPGARLWLPPFVQPVDDSIAIRPALLRPRSRGELLLRSADPLAKPRIHYNFLSDPEDLATLVRGARLALEVARQKPLAGFKRPGPGAPAGTSDADLAAWIRATAVTVHHPCGTCAIGPVLDAELRVHGTQGLRVVDASAMPSIVGAHINACVLMVAERGAEFIQHKPAWPPIPGG